MWEFRHLGLAIAWMKEGYYDRAWAEVDAAEGPEDPEGPRLDLIFPPPTVGYFRGQLDGIVGKMRGTDAARGGEAFAEP